MDFRSLCLPQVVPWGDKEALAILQRQLDVDILVTGHTHDFKVRCVLGWRYSAVLHWRCQHAAATCVLTHLLLLQAVMYEDRLQINPGSATGAYSTITEDVKPSFVLMDLDGDKVPALPNLL